MKNTPTNQSRRNGGSRTSFSRLTTGKGLPATKSGRGTRTIGGTKSCPMISKNSSPRIIARKSKLRALTPTQVNALRRWLIVDQLTYDQTRVRLRERFSISLSTGTLSRFWNTYCLPAAPPPHDRRPHVFLDVVLHSTRPVRLLINENNSRLRFKVGRMRQRGLNKKTTFTIDSAGVHKGKP